jgi:hypothetical protein
MTDTAISQNNLNRIFAYIEQKRNAERGNEYERRYERQARNTVFGEELQGYIPFAPNRIHHSIIVRDPLAVVKSLAAQITTHYYNGEPKFVDMTASVYNDFLSARKTQGFKGVQGMNAKGLVCAILYAIILHREKARLDMNKLIMSANKVKSPSKTTITKRMVFKYLSHIVSLLQTDANSLNNNNNNDKNDPTSKLNEDIKRLCYLLGFRMKDVVVVRKDAERILFRKPELLEHHNVTTLSIAFTYKYAMSIPNMNVKNVRQTLGITPYIINKVLPKILVTTSNVSVVRGA